MISPALPPAIADAAAAEPGRAALIEEYFRHLPQEDLPESADEAGAIVDTHIRLARHRRPGECAVRVFNPRTRSEDSQNVTVVDIVNDDMPHLVEAVVGTLTAAGVRVFRVQHPILVVRRADDGRLQDVIGGAHGPWARGLSGAGDGFVRESWMHVLIDRLADAERAEAIEEQLTAALADVRAIVQDSAAMTAAVHEIADLVSAGAVDGAAHGQPMHGQAMHGQAMQSDAAGVTEVVGGQLDAAEVADLLDWLADDNMVFLGIREEHRTDGESAAEGLGVLRAAGPNSSAVVDLSVTDSGADASTIAITQAGRASVLNAAATPLCLVLRTPTGDRWRVLGVLQPRAVAADLASVPVLRRTLATVLHELGASAESFTGQRAIDLLSGYPRAELFWADPDQVAALAADVLHGSSRRRLRVYLQHDPRGRFVTALVFLARDRWTTANRLRMQDVLLETLHGNDIRYGARVGQAELAVAQFVVQTDADATSEHAAEVDVDALTGRLRDVLRSWEDDLLAAVSGTDDVLDTAEVLARYSTAFDEAYKENYRAEDAVADLEILDALDGPDDLTLTIALPRPEDTDGRDDSGDDPQSTAGVGAGPSRGTMHARVGVDRRLKLFVAGRSISLSQVFPVLQSMGAEVVDEHPYSVRRTDGTPCRIYDFGLAFDPADLPDEADQLAARRRFIDAFVAAWRGWSETDGFNRLILGSGLDWRQIAVLRAYSHYLQQIGTPYTQTYIQQVLSQYGTLAADLSELFVTRFDPERGSDADARTRRVQELTAAFDAELDSVASLDADRILRSVCSVILATDRTNAYREGSEGTLAFKLVPARIPDVPRPVPAHEIWVYSPSVEGVHLRFGDVARGGLRWSDRPEDFRTEILGLVKAQEVKNAVIVPVGAKGGFVVRRPAAPTGDPQRDREAQQATGIACYQEFIGALLDVTDNRVEGRIEPPDSVVRHDGDDPYLVVAADKGTATFSDIANALAVQRGFWLGDAFASGGSAGYDHKGMGITARGAWESVKHHFTELGVDTQTQEFTCVGVGDMSGDVFGNGMLLSDRIRLVAAFDHRHIFVDPDPDASTGFAERRRLFDLPRSSWADYDTALISAGGGVFPRTAKSIPVGRELRAALGLDDVTELSPLALIRAILQAPVDLLWNGGIGTYVKASSESQAMVGDKANDPVRVDADQLRARVVGEGGNLGITQLGRIQFAQLGGRINTDAIDNSAGVDTSDHEVNIKIALAPEVAAGRLTLPERNELLASMTQEVGALVLVDNIAQNQLLGVSRSHAPLMLSVHQRLIRSLVSAGSLNRELEFLPSDETIDERIAAGLGLTSPELSVLVAYVKSQAATEILGSGLADDPAFTAGLPGYFPSAMRAPWSDAIQEHPLRREIVTTIAANEVVNGGGISYLFRIQEETAAAVTDGVRAFAVTSKVFGLPAVWQEISDLSARVPAPAKDALLLSLRRLLDRASRWFLSHRPQPLDVLGEVERYVVLAADLAARMPELLQGVEADNVARDRDHLVELGAPLELAGRVAHSLYAFSLLDVVDVAEATGREPAEAAAVYYDLSAHLDFDRLLTAVTELERGDRWHALARQSVRDDLYRSMSLLTADVLSASTSEQDAAAKIERWEHQNASRLARARITLAEIAASGQGDLAALSVAAREFRSMVR